MSTRRFLFLRCRCALILAVVVSVVPLRALAQDVLEMELSVLEDKIRGGWAGQMVGVAYGAPVEFAALEEIYEKPISWSPDRVKGALAQDDLQIEMTFAEVMDTVGLDATAEQYGDAFRDSTYLLFHANASARRNLNNGIKAPMSGHPKYNLHANDIDFQIEADFIGMMCPGMPQMAIELCDRVGHVMNYGDGVYGGTFVSGMYAAAYFETGVQKVVEAGAACLPEGSGYRAIIEDVMAAHKKHPEDWRECWRIISEKWDTHDPCPEGAMEPFNIDARLNGAFIAIGLLYGQGDMGKTLEIATRCGQDADCNPASAAGVLGLMYGFKALDEKWVGEIEGIADQKFVGTNYSFNAIVASTRARALDAARRSGGEVRGGRVIIPKQTPVPPPLEQWSPGIPVKSYYHDDPAWTWTGAWEEEKSTTYAAPAGNVSHAGGNVAVLEFSGSAVSLVGYATTNGGMAEVFLDGEKAGVINAYIGPGTFEQDLWRAYDLKDGPHSLRIVTLDESDPRMQDSCGPSMGMGVTDDRPKRFPIHRAVAYRPEDTVLKKIAVETVRDKIYASWLAQCVGNIYGLPHENAHIDEPGPDAFPYGYGRNIGALELSKGAFSDDDTDIEYMYLLAMEDFGPEPTLAELASKWMYHVRDRVWLANRAALAAMHYGYTPPVTGKRGINPHWFQIDPQLINEVWAVTAPGMVRYAADKSGWAALVMTDGWGIEPTIWYGAMYAAAFFESDVEKLIDIGVEALPPGSRFAQTVADMKALYLKYPGDWRRARQEMAQQYYHDEPLDTKTIWNANLNGACAVLGMLYGQGDFQKTLDLNCAMGFDADNQAATVAGLLGVVLGVDGIPEELLFPLPELDWKLPLNDSYKNVTRHDMDDAALTDLADRMLAQAEKIIVARGGRRVSENGEDFYVINTAANFVAPLELPAGPAPLIEAGAFVDYAMAFIGGKAPYRWRVGKGKLPDGLEFNGGRFTGTASKPGIYEVTVNLQDAAGESLSQPVTLVVRTKNLAPSANEVLASVPKTDAPKRDAMWLTVPPSLYANAVAGMIRDGKRLGDGQTFYSISADLTKETQEKKDYYGYAWGSKQTLGLLAYHTGAVEEMGGWFTSLDVEYRDAAGQWRPVKGLVIAPPLMPGEERFNKPHFVEYLLAFEPVATTAIRMIGDTGGVRHWTRDYVTHFSSISELGAYGALPEYEDLNR